MARRRRSRSKAARNRNATPTSTQRWIATKSSGPKSSNAAASKALIVLLDARNGPRYRGEVEPIDKKAGHIPGALNRPFSDNLDANGRFKSPEHLRREFYPLIGVFQPWQVVHMCGSGVTACHNLLAMEAAGMQGSRVFAPNRGKWVDQ